MADDLKAQARRELARRELARRRAAAAPTAQPPVRNLGTRAGAMAGAPVEATPMDFLRDVGQFADDGVRRTANTLLGGSADKFAAGMDAMVGDLMGRENAGYSENLKNERVKSEEADKRLGPARFAFDVVAGAGTGMGMLQSGLTAARFAGPKVAALIDGTALGALAGLGNDDSGSIEEKIKSAGIGGAVGGAVGGGGAALMSGASKLFQGKTAKPAMSLDELKEARSAAYPSAEEGKSVLIARPAIEDVRDRMQATMTDMGFRPARHPTADRAFSEVSGDAANDFTTLTGLQGLRGFLTSEAKDVAGKQDASMIRSAITAIDDILDGARPGNVTGDPKMLGRIKEGNKFYKQEKKAELVMESMKRAEEAASRANSGGNIQNALKQEFVRIRRSKDFSRFTPDEKAAVENLIHKSGGGKMTRTLAKLSPQGSGLTTMASLGATATNPLYAIPFALGTGVKALSDRGTKKASEDLLETILSMGVKNKKTKGKISPDAAKALNIARTLMLPGLAAPLASQQATGP
ncbi:MAG: hypothetical protein ACRCU5_16570 [Rhizobiaceae bacterium]